MKHRTENDYYTMWTEIINRMDENGIDIQEKPMLVLDFEKAASNAFKTQFPDGVVYRCHFHYSQAVIRNLKKHNLYQLYTNVNDVRLPLKQLLALPFLPDNLVIEIFLKIKDSLPESAWSFMEYFEKTFIRGKLLRETRTEKSVYNKPLYESCEWNVYSRFEEDLARTTNIAEAFHRKLQCCNYNGDHPTLFQLGKLLLDINLRHCHQMMQHTCAYNSWSSTKEAEQKECQARRQLEAAFPKVFSGEMALEDYLIGCGGNAFTW